MNEIACRIGVIIADPGIGDRVRALEYLILGEYWFLNDSTRPDGAQEFAVVKKDGGNGNPVQVTFGWCSDAQALEHIRATLEGQSIFYGERIHYCVVL